MMEAGANEVDEDTVFEAIQMAQDVNLEIISLQDDFQEEAGKEKSEFVSRGHDPEAVDQAKEVLGNRIYEALVASSDQDDMKIKLSELEEELTNSLEDFDSSVASGAFEELLDEQFRERILKDNVRPDGRGLKEIRPLSADVSLLPRTHGSGLFNRGETQILALTTLGLSLIHI